MRYIYVIIMVIFLASCKREKKFELGGMVVIDKSGTVDFAKESGIDTITLQKAEDGTYRIVGFGKQEETENRISISINELKQK